MGQIDVTDSYHEFNCNLNLFGNFDEDEKYRITKKCM